MITIIVFFSQSFFVFNCSSRLIYLLYGDEAITERLARKTRANFWFTPLHVHKKLSMLISLQQKFAINNKYLVSDVCIQAPKLNMYSTDVFLVNVTS